MKKFFPPMHELVSFEACARHRNFTQAAGELSVTVSAVSRQVQSLEHRLGVLLFRRAGGRATTTEAGERLLLKILPALRLIDSAAADVLSSGNESACLNLSVLPTFALQWLIPRIPEFNARYPEVSIHLRPHLTGIEALPEDLHAAIRFGLGTWPGCRSDYLLGRSMVVICSPDWLNARRSLTKPSDMLTQSLLHHVARPLAWGEWFSQAQVRAPESLPGPRFEQYSLIIQSVVSGMGAGLVPACFVEQHIREKKLIKPFSCDLASDAGYFLVWKEEMSSSASLTKFHSWIRSAARKSV